MESIFPSTVQSVITDELLYPSFVCSFIQVSYIRGLPFLMIVYIVITVSYIVLFQFRIQLFFFYTGPMSIAVFITAKVIHLNYVISVVLSFLDVIKSKIL